MEAAKAKETPETPRNARDALEFAFYEIDCDARDVGFRCVAYEVTQLVPGGWAEGVGVELGDEVVEVDGLEVAAVRLSDAQVQAALNGRLRKVGESSTQKGGAPGNSSPVNQSTPTPRPARRIKFKRPNLRGSYFELELPVEENDEGELKRPKLGIDYLRTEIVGLEPGGWAAEQGLQVGDEILEIDGQPFRAMKDAKGLQLMTQPRPLQLRFKRSALKPEFFELSCVSGAPAKNGLGMLYEGGSVTEVFGGGWAEQNGSIDDFYFMSSLLDRVLCFGTIVAKNSGALVREESLVHGKP